MFLEKEPEAFYIRLPGGGRAGFIDVIPSSFSKHTPPTSSEACGIALLQAIPLFVAECLLKGRCFSG